MEYWSIGITEVWVMGSFGFLKDAGLNHRLADAEMNH
jgi:hypothetical protein